jgi:hypothetical protein
MDGAFAFNPFDEHSGGGSYEQRLVNSGLDEDYAP